MLRLSNNLSHQDGSVSSHRLPEGSFDYLAIVLTSLEVLTSLVGCCSFSASLYSELILPSTVQKHSSTTSSYLPLNSPSSVFHVL